uniref:Uncharacterized protein n=1 Tax=Megaselia scalaris TaxID=36166 RepID=T1GNL0_MEGSC
MKCTASVGFLFPLNLKLHLRTTSINSASSDFLRQQESCRQDFPRLEEVVLGLKGFGVWRGPYSFHGMFSSFHNWAVDE